MSNAQKLTKLSIDDYLRMEEAAAVKHEYVDGEVFAMTGGTAAHSLIALNVATALRNQLKGSNCTVYGSDYKVRVEAKNSFYYPDVSVDCSGYDGDTCNHIRGSLPLHGSHRPKGKTGCIQTHSFSSSIYPCSTNPKTNCGLLER